MKRAWRCIVAAGIVGSEAAVLLMIAAAPLWTWTLLWMLVTGASGTGIGIAMYLLTTWYSQKGRDKDGKP